MRFKMVKKATFDKNIKSGKWVMVHPAKDGNGGLVKIPKAGPGCDNPAGRMISINIALDKPDI